MPCKVVRWDSGSSVWQLLLLASSHSLSQLTSCFAEFLQNFKQSVHGVYTACHDKLWKFDLLDFIPSTQLTSLELSAVMSSLGDRRRCDTRTFRTALDRSSKAWHHLDMKRFKSAGRPARLPLWCHNCPLWCHTPCSNDWKPCLSGLSSSCQIFDGRRPQLVPSEARSRGSLAL